MNCKWVLKECGCGDERYYLITTSCGLGPSYDNVIEQIDVDHFKFCPYCGKEIEKEVRDNG